MLMFIIQIVDSQCKNTFDVKMFFVLFSQTNLITIWNILDQLKTSWVKYSA